jgi:hypothetical protein
MDLESLSKRIGLVSTRVKNINLGGCGVFALELSRILREECGMGNKWVRTVNYYCFIFNI